MWLVAMLHIKSKLQLTPGSFNSQECQNLKFKKNLKFHFEKYWKTNGTMQKYCWRGFDLNGHTTGFHKQTQK